PLECAYALNFSTFDRRRILNAPVDFTRLTRQNGADLAGGVATDSYDEIHHGCAACGKFFPALAPQPARRNTALLQEPQRQGMDLTFRVAARAKGPESTLGQTIK